MTDTTITFRIDSDKKEEWEEAVEEKAKYHSLTHLIRLSVVNELSEDSENQVEVEMSGVNETLSNINTKLDDLQDEIHVTQQAIEWTTEEKADAITPEIYELIPNFASHKAAQDTIESSPKDWAAEFKSPSKPIQNYIKETGVVRGLYHHLSASTDAIDDAVDQLTESFDDVVITTDSANNKYLVEVKDD